MNILEAIKDVLGAEDVYISRFPDDQDNAAALFENEGEPPERYFGEALYKHNIEVKVRGLDPQEAYERMENIQDIMRKHRSEKFSVRQAAAIQALGYDEHDPPRYQYTVKYIIYTK